MQSFFWETFVMWKSFINLPASSSFQVTVSFMTLKLMNQIYCNLRFLSFYISSKAFFTDYDEKIVTIIEHEFLSCVFWNSWKRGNFSGNEKLFSRNLPWCIVNPRNQFSSRLQWHRRFLLPLFFPTLNDALKR